MTTAVIILLLFGLLLYYLLRLEPVQDFIAQLLDDHKKPGSVIRGEVGELKVNRMLDTLPPTEYTTYCNLYVPSPKTKKRPFSEVDHIVVSRYGIFVIETKSFTGAIDAKESWKKWYYSGTRRHFDNPINQNKGHVHDLREFLELESNQLHSLVFFINGNPFKHPIPPNVYNRDFLQPINVIQQPSLGGVQVEQINAKLRRLSDPTYKEAAAIEHKAHLATYNVRSTSSHTTRRR